MSDPIINFDDHIKNKKNNIKQNKKSFPWPGTCICYGVPGAGKTNFTVQFILSPTFHLFFDNLMIFASDIFDSKWQLVKEKFEKIEEKLSKKYKKDVKILTMSNRLSDIPIIDTLDRDKQTLIVFDDFIEKAKNKEHEIITSYFTRSRRMNCFVFYLTQSYFEIPRAQRTSCSYLVLFKINNLFDLKAIHRDTVHDMPIDEFIQAYYDILRNNEHGYVIIDLKNSDPSQKIRSTIVPKKTIKNK